MRTDVKRNVAGAVLGVVISCGVLVACGHQESGKAKPMHSYSMTPLGKVCEGIFDPETRAEAVKLLGSDQVNWYPPTKDDFDGNSSKVAEILARGMNMEYMANRSCVFNKKPGQRTALEIWFEWWPETLKTVPGAGHVKGTSAAYELSTGSSLMSRLFVDCQRPDLVEPGDQMSVVEVMITDRIGLSRQSRVRLLNASAEKVTAQLDCKNKVVLPEAHVVTEEDPRLK
ncbi:hypothetical protein NRF20_28220 [Streptomyces sp. R-74717]|uniref:hypothetical protein n=1 Tax=Streptomyces sp. R-74717 TaxID=2969820 RepID=UPI0039B3FCAF